MLSAVVSRKRLTTPTTYIFILWMIGSSLVLLIVAAIFSAQPGEVAAPARGRRRGVRQGPAGRVLQARGRARSAPGGGRLHPDARPHPAPDPPAHRDAGRRVARSAHAADAHEARARAAGRQPDRRRAEIRCRRDGAAGPALSRFRPRRGHRNPGRDRHRAADRGPRRGDAARGHGDCRSTSRPSWSCRSGRTRCAAASAT